ncbi:MAG: anhydro-N-acetylmuramic acid kinase [Synechococcus sp.]|uniref:anhydro-N-acetylmuramic acid kinase n=1 Tax=Synechococcus sp. BMK-MC-1 TaxID=1442551 RepID=UPI00164949B3|nr:anhydro-N-acetylmuramic acid kinase [Synechococcus sp. BMK-MC-1]QNI68801.1 anhydro-N-acetylmuramic acid kinase [Synechococcus sp. BMK-MC-1]
MRVLGLMSGTSADGVDAALAQFHGRPEAPHWDLLNTASVPYPSALKERLIRMAQGEPTRACDVLEMSEAVTEIQAAAAHLCDPEQSASLLGCHGQTMWHRPPVPSSEPSRGSGRRGASWQMLQAPLLAHLSGRPVIHDFRAADLALGGQGAPLVPMADAALMGRIDGWRGLLNLGGIANITLIPPNAGPDRQHPVLGWDCGPANTLMDLAMTRLSGGQDTFDLDGALAGRGTVCEETLERWLQEPYFLSSPPKSTGREVFGQEDLNRRLQQLAPHSAANQLATLTAFSAAVVAQDLRRLTATGQPQPVELLVAGGGCRNQTLMRQLRQRCLGVRVRPSSDLNLPTQFREALVFALLAWWHQRGHPGNAPAITGAAKATVLGLRVNPV